MIDISKVFIEETLKEPTFEVCDETLSHVLSAYGLSTAGITKSIRKPNETSRLFEFNNGLPYILRVAPIEMRDSAEAQCFVFNALPDQICIKPLETKKGTYTFPYGEEFWTCYPKKLGHQAICLPEKLTDFLWVALEVEQYLSSIPQNEELKNLPVVNMRMSVWSNIINEIDASFKDDSSILYGHLSQQTYDLFTSMKEEICQKLEALSDLEFTEDLVHYDMHHANIIQSPSDSLCLIDFEDIVWGDRKVALGHAIFKWARHCVYLDSKSFGKVAHWLQNSCLQSMARFSIKYKSSQDLEYYVLARIVADLSLILESVFLERKNDFVYDYNKKVSNLLEAILLFKKTGGVREL